MSGGLEGFFLARGPCSVRLLEGDLEVLGGALGEGGFVIVPAGRAALLRASGARAEVSGCSLEPVEGRVYESYESAAREASGRGRVVVVGPTDSGKSTLAAWILNKWGGGRVLEADIGQNEIFAPGFEALAEPSGGVVVPGFVESFSSVKPCFVGSFTPSSAESKYLACAARLAREAGDRLVVDTDGWVQAWGGLYSKAALTLAVGARLVVALGMSGRSCRALEDLSGVEVLCLPRLAGGGGKSREERSTHRDRLLARRLVGAREWRLSLNEVEVRGAPVFHGEEVPLDEARKVEPGAVYAELQEGIGLAIVARGQGQRRPGVRLVRAGWERGLLAAAHSRGSVEVAVLLSVDYKARRITVASRIGEKPRLIEVGVVRVDYESLSGSVPLG